MSNLELVTWQSLDSDYGKSIIAANKAYDVTVKNITAGVSIYDFEDIKSGPEWDELVKETVLSIMANIQMPRRYTINGQVRDTYHYYEARWKRGLTAGSYNYLESYEVDEKVGDSGAKAGVMAYMQKNYPNMSPQTMSETTSHMLSKAVQGKISIALGWAAALRTGFVERDANGKIHYKYTISTAEDVFESIFGVIQAVGDDIGRELAREAARRAGRDENTGTNYGGGSHFIYNMILWMIENKHIIIKETADLPPKTAVQQLFSGKKWGKVIRDISVTKKGDVTVYTCKLGFTARAIRDLKHNSSMINFTTADMVHMIEHPDEDVKDTVMPSYIALANDKFFGTGESHDEESARMAAYVNGADRLKKIGILTNIDAARGYNQFTTVDLLPYFYPAYMKAKKLGYTNLYVSKKAEKKDANTDSYDFQLYGSGPNGVDLLLSAVVPRVAGVDLTVSDIRMILYQRYASS